MMWYKLYIHLGLFVIFTDPAYPLAHKNKSIFHAQPVLCVLVSILVPVGGLVSTGRKPFVALKRLSLYEKLMANKSYIHDISSSTVKAAISLWDVAVAGWTDQSSSLISILLDLSDQTNLLTVAYDRALFP